MTSLGPALAELAGSPILAGAAAHRWLAELPGAVEHWRAHWSLRPAAGPARAGAHSLVVPVVRGDEPCVLKITWRGDDPPGEAPALRTWDGRGAVRLLDADPGGDVLLLERLDADRTLRTVPPGTAAAVAGALIRRLAVAPPPRLRSLAGVAGALAGSLERRQAGLGHPVPPGRLAEAVALAHGLSTGGADTLVHGDLHGGNVLARGDDWVAIDPEPGVGDPEAAVPELLWTRLDELPTRAAVRGHLAQVVAAGALDAERARAWALARAVDYWLWGLAHGLTEDPVRCARLVDCLT